MIQYIDRKSKKIIAEKVYGEKALSLLYGSGVCSQFFYYTLLRFLAYVPFFSIVYGYLQKSNASQRKIAPFIQKYGVDSSEFEKKDFASFNDFFIRKLNLKCRPIDPNPHRIAMPADGRYLVYPKIADFTVKGQKFSLSSFLQNSVLTRRFEGGAMTIVRLAPVDYHRFHFPCDGMPEPSCLINGPLFSVNPLAIQRRFATLFENKRVVTEIDTDHFGTILFAEIGATSVGTIRQTFKPLQKVKKGEEKGYFEFGGSCIVLLFEKDRIQFDADLIHNTQKGYETLAHFGESLGSSLS